jgi:hypothetical protein
MSHGLASGAGVTILFEAMSFSMALSSIASANGFFRLALSLSSVFNRRASATPKQDCAI